jgi:hypothetical protein
MAIGLLGAAKWRQDTPFAWRLNWIGANEDLGADSRATSNRIALGANRPEFGRLH